MADSDRKIHDSQTLVDGNLLAAKAFAAAGVTLMFGVVGILVTSFARRAASIGFRFLAFHNEQSAGYAASAYGYLTGKPGLLLTVSGPDCPFSKFSAKATDISQIPKSLFKALSL
ncbi:hypothetical protein PVL29_025948 [Vitis rotundifolia]|uniref:Thiamine pyrophosphate enzyme N-terminal TPP-binding domain-containing protein n=1 Tax=Vitis rotundifolia TaxID=103349 RepID=A0AA38YLE8_VITRO|nr:hypothetical protein PVL29_025948 [Vitis rotundifolia]